MNQEKWSLLLLFTRSKKSYTQAGGRQTHQSGSELGWAGLGWAGWASPRLKVKGKKIVWQQSYCKKKGGRGRAEEGAGSGALIDGSSRRLEAEEGWRGGLEGGRMPLPARVCTIHIYQFGCRHKMSKIFIVPFD